MTTHVPLTEVCRIGQTGQVAPQHAGKAFSGDLVAARVLHPNMEELHVAESYMRKKHAQGSHALLMANGQFGWHGVIVV